MSTIIENNKNLLAEAVCEHRWYSGKMLSEEDFSTDEKWVNYTQTVSALATNCYNFVVGKSSNIGGEVKALFEMFGIATTGLSQYQRRFIVACVQMKRVYSDAYKTAKKSLRTSTGELDVLVETIRKVKPQLYTKTNEELGEVYPAVKSAIAKVKEAEALVTKLEGESGNIYIDYQINARATGKSGNMKMTATKDCRKKVEDIIADIIDERSLMTAKDLLKEAEAIKASRKTNKKINAMTEEQALEALGIAINATAK